MLDSADARVNLVPVLLFAQVGKVKIGIPGRIAVRKIMGVICPGERADGIDVGRMDLHQSPQILAACPGAEHAARRMIAFGDKRGKKRICRDDA
jgi:hypothetical protein